LNPNGKILEMVLKPNLLWLLHYFLVVTQADFESDEMVIYSGSISAAKLAPAFPILNPAFVKLPN
jgi:hypothetical protein